MMVTVSVLAILVSLGVPAFQAFSLKQSMSSAINALHNDLLVGRSHAINRTTQVVSCPGNPYRGCTGFGNWSDGWIVFDDPNADQAFQDGETILRHGQKVENLVILGSSGRSNIRFYPNGTAPGSNGSISFCGLGGPEKARKLVISNLGRIRRDSAPTTGEEKCP
jgi:type IV fimbrial biogenesis protein FimT